MKYKAYHGNLCFFVFFFLKAEDGIRGLVRSRELGNVYKSEEEWRKGWHPERFEQPGSDDSILIVGGGPAGLEAGLTAARRGYQVTIADKNTKMGGRLIYETKLPRSLIHISRCRRT